MLLEIACRIEQVDVYGIKTPVSNFSNGPSLGCAHDFPVIDFLLS